MIALRTSALLAAIASLVSAQTPPGFSPAPVNNQTLGVTYGSNSVMPAGELIPRPGIYLLRCFPPLPPSNTSLQKSRLPLP